ncbi:ABC transporter permease [Saccharopolyspora sp. CA-218241]|uniref:ABC transporter permease n=1 Tax=Saccharopolyspora sp. CA-218241 TaxID=3240027 RepID=UPI003D95D6B7
MTEENVATNAGLRSADPGEGSSLRAALSSGPPPSPPGPTAAALVLGWRALLKIKHNPQQLFDAVAFPIMITLIFTFLFGGAIAGSTGDYLQYVLPGILVLAVVMISMNTGVALNTDVAKGIFDRFRSMPIWRPATLVGPLLGDAVRYAVAATVALVVGVLLGFRPSGGVLGAVLGVLMAILFAFSLAWLWTVLGMLMREPESVMNVSSMALFPLAFGSNIFVDPQTMPSWLEVVVTINPVTHAVAAVRGLMHGSLDAGQLLWALLICAVLVLALAPITLYLYLNKN